MKNFLKFLINALPPRLRSVAEWIWLRISRPRLLESYARYHQSDSENKFTHILEAMNYLRVAGLNGVILPPTYFEFGCHSARTFCAAVNAAKAVNLVNAKFIAFDSFEGLPATDPLEDGYFSRGDYATSQSQFMRIVRKKTGLGLLDYKVVKGFYSESLTKDLQARLPKAGVVHIDVDLYSSAMEVLLFLRPLLVQGTVLLFDDWYAFRAGELKGERKALTEFIEQNYGFEVEPWKSYSTFGKSFFVTRVPDV